MIVYLIFSSTYLHLFQTGSEIGAVLVTSRHVQELHLVAGGKVERETHSNFSYSRTFCARSGIVGGYDNVAMVEEILFNSSRVVRGLTSQTAGLLKG